MFESSSFGIFFNTFWIFLAALPFLLPFLLAYVLWTLWKNYTNILFMADMKWIMLEITPPPEAQKTPLSMELVLMALHQPNSGNFFERLWKGQIRRWSSLEIVSIGGEVRFIIRTEERHRNFLEAQLYSQYPSIEIREVPDYVYDVDYRGDNEEWQLWASEYILAKPDPYPIRTYVDFQLDKPVQKDVMEETKTDPLNSIIEIFGSIGPNEQLWLQILIRASEKKYRDPGKWFGKRDIKGEAKALIKELQAKVKEGAATKGDQDAMAAIERRISKPFYDVGIRVVYVAKPESFRFPVTTGLRGMWKPFGSEVMNGFKAFDATSSEYPFSEWDYDWSRLKFKRVSAIQHEMFDAYQQRAFFYIPYKKKFFTLNTEELATIYHIPSKASQTPGLLRIGSHKGTPPTNLPI